MAPENKTQAWRGGIPLYTGFLAILVLVGGLGVWGVRANIAGAVVTSGMIEVESNRQVIQHPDGGVVGEIFVKDGDVVEAGDVLIVLDGTRLQSELTIVNGQLQEIAARQARLEAERDGATEIDFGDDIAALAETDSDTRDQVEGEAALFNARREALTQEIALLGEQNQQIDNRVVGIEAQLEALRAQEDLIGQELEDQQSLLDQQLTQASQVLDLQRQKADLLGQIGRLESEIAELRGQSASNEIELLQLETRRREEAVSELRDMQFRQVELLERRSALKETISRLDVRAPVSGIVYNSQVFAVQSVVQPAEPLMYIIPQDQPLVVSARINAINIDEVFVGQEAALRFSAFDQREMPEIKGQLSRISADVILDEATGLNYYATEILPYEEELTVLGDQKLLPGMPVEVFIRTSDRTAFEYLTQPLMNFFNRAFRE
ncbi:HlyD family type I secretion periplasmic adaptor subunit [Aliiroseovarius sp. YM-037]|uniref:HlyD family type I secretion periplasmic adaptor subunit n=1 Tax=Aliiroseovarius sp. YM-037 TaxID=3341728 RepID=UPI003A7F69B9